MQPLTVLLTNFDLNLRGGSQLYVRDVALGLLRRGHRPVAFSQTLGGVARELRDATVPVVDDLRRLSVVPDIIHGQHNHELFASLLRFPGVPAVRVCHGWLDEAPQPFPRILRYIAVDDTTRDRCLCEWGLPPDRVEVLLNFVDLQKFSLRTPLPDRPARALVFSNNASDHVQPVKDACAAFGVEVDAVGRSLGNTTDRPERLLGSYDLIFAKGRSALEGIASGAAVILCDAAGVGPMVTAVDLPRLRRLNFGIRTLQAPLRVEAITEQIGRYSPEDARRVTDEIRSTAGAETAIDELIATYREVIAAFQERLVTDIGAELSAAADYLEWVGRKIRWVESPKSAGYAFLQSMYMEAKRVPGLRRVVALPWVRRLAYDARSRRAGLTDPR